MPKLKSKSSNPKREISDQPGLTKYDLLMQDTAEWIHWCYIVSDGGKPEEHGFAETVSYQAQAKYRRLAGVMLANRFDNWKIAKDRDPDEPERVEL